MRRQRLYERASRAFQDGVGHGLIDPSRPPRPDPTGRRGGGPLGVARERGVQVGAAYRTEVDTGTRKGYCPPDEMDSLTWALVLAEAQRP